MVAILEQKEYEQVLSWCRAHEKLLSIFDEGCEDFFVCHKLWNCEAKAQAYKKLALFVARREVAKMPPIDKSIFMCYHNDSIANHHTSSEVLSC